MAKYFRKHETLDPPDSSRTAQDLTPLLEEFHGTDGPIHTSVNDWRVPIEIDIMLGCEEVAGMPQEPRDAWSGDHMGFYSSLSSVDRTNQKGTRSYSAVGYLLPNLSRSNLRVICEAMSQ